jgi:hypothetical protein
VTNVEEDLEDGLLDILRLRRRETPGVSLSESKLPTRNDLGRIDNVRNCFQLRCFSA